MKVTFDLPPNASKDMLELGKHFDCLDDAAMSALCIGTAILLKSAKAREQCRAIHRHDKDPSVQTIQA